MPRSAEDDEWGDFPVLVSYASADAEWRDRVRELIADEYEVLTADEGTIRGVGEGVLIVIVGPGAAGSDKLDREVRAALDRTEPLGLVGVCTTDHPDFGSKDFESENVPPRLVANLRSEYAEMYDWSDDAERVEEWIEEAYAKSVDETDRVRNERAVAEEPPVEG